MLSVHVTRVLFLIWFNNFALTMGFYWSYTLFHALTLVARSYALLQSIIGGFYQHCWHSIIEQRLSINAYTLIISMNIII